MLIMVLLRCRILPLVASNFLRFLVTRSIKTDAKINLLALEFVICFFFFPFWFVEETYICLQNG